MGESINNSMLVFIDELSKKWIDRLADTGVGTIGLHPYGGRLAVRSLENLLEMLKTSNYRDLIDYAHVCGLEVEYEMHAAGYLLPRELFSAHPEYFRMNEKGERVNDWNLCVSNSDAVELFAKNAAELALSLYGSSHNFYFWLDDGHDIHCHCPKCRNLSPSDQQLFLVNRMAREIRKHIPDARVAYLAYMNSLVPPTEFSAEDGVFLEYAPFEKYTAKGENAAEIIENEKRSIAPLKKIFEKEPSKVLEYWYDNSMYSHWEKPPVKFVADEVAMCRDIEEYFDMGFDAVSTFACFLGEDYEKLHGDVNVLPFVDCVRRHSK